MRADPPQQERDHPRGAHIEHLEGVALEADVVAEPFRLLGRVGVAVDVDHQPEVIGGLQLTAAGPGQACQPQRDHRLAHAMGHRLPQAQVGRVGQARHQLSDPDAVGPRPDNHNQSLRGRTATDDHGAGHWPAPGQRQDQDILAGTPPAGPASHRGSGGCMLAVATAQGPCPESAAPEVPWRSQTAARAEPTEDQGARAAVIRPAANSAGSHRGTAWLRHRAIPVRMVATGILAKYPAKNTLAMAAVLPDTSIWAAADGERAAAAAARLNPISTFTTAPQKAPNHPITAAKEPLRPYPVTRWWSPGRP